MKLHEEHGAEHAESFGVREVEPRGFEFLLDHAVEQEGQGGYRRAVAEPETIVWIPHDTSAGLALGITAALAVRDPSGRVIGVVTVKFARSGIAGFLRSINRGARLGRSLRLGR